MKVALITLVTFILVAGKVFARGTPAAVSVVYGPNGGATKTIYGSNGSSAILKAGPNGGFSATTYNAKTGVISQTKIAPK